MSEVYTMPEVDVRPLKGVLSEEDMQLINEVLYYDSEKKLKFLRIGKPRHASLSGQWLWRKLAFHISPDPKHQTLPVTPYDIRGTEEENRVEKIFQQVLKLIPKDKRYGEKEWLSHF